MLSSPQKFRLFAIGKKTIQMLNLHFGRKYHFVISGNGILACFLVIYVDVLDRLFMCDLHVLVDVFDRLLRRYAPLPLTLRGGTYIPISEKTMMRVYSTDNQHGNLAPPLS